jgi:hypothetical protein
MCPRKRAFLKKFYNKKKKKFGPRDFLKYGRFCVGQGQETEGIGIEIYPDSILYTFLIYFYFNVIFFYK